MGSLVGLALLTHIAFAYQASNLHVRTKGSLFLHLEIGSEDGNAMEGLKVELRNNLTLAQKCTSSFTICLKVFVVLPFTRLSWECYQILQLYLFASKISIFPPPLCDS